MFKKISMWFFILLMIPALTLVGCKKGDDNDDRLFKANEDFKIEASADNQNINLKISNVKKASGVKNKEVLDVLMLKPYEYYEGEEDMGIYYQTNNYSTGKDVGDFKVNTKKGAEDTISFSRFDNGYDNLYNKFILVDRDGEFVAGPFLVNNVQSQRTYSQKIQETTKKGLFMNGDENDLVDLGCGWTEYNVCPNLLVFPNEKPGENGEIVQIDNSSKPSTEAIPFVSNGKTYYFKAYEIGVLDFHLKYCKEHNIRSAMIIWNDKLYDPNVIPYYMTYPDTVNNPDSAIYAIDTSTELGAGYFTAVMEFLAERYSHEDGEFGYCHRFIIGNEIDISWDWNPIMNYKTRNPLPLDEYVEEYLRMLRIADQATKKYYSDSMVLVSTAHYWNGTDGKSTSYRPKEIYDYLNAKVTYEGNFNWGMASHPYPQDLGDPNYLQNEVSNGKVKFDQTTAAITWTNLELYDQYFSQDQFLYEGKIRRLYLTEGGVSSGAYNFADRYELFQAAGIAYAFYKSLSMSCVDAFIYYKLVDTPEAEGGSTFGLRRSNLAKKPSYDMFKYMDTQYSFDVTGLYLDYILFRYNKTFYSVEDGNIHSYVDAMKVLNPGYNWDEAFKENKFKLRQVSDYPDILL